MDRNLLLAIILSAGVLLIWETTIGAQQRESLKAARQASKEIEANDPVGNLTPERTTGTISGSSAQTFLPLDQALATAPAGRIPVDTPALRGSINLSGGRFDDLVLKNYRETIEPDSGNIQLLKPENVEHGHFMEQGWLVNGQNSLREVWQAPEGARLTPTTPVTLVRRKDGLEFEKTISVDENFMFTISQTVRNSTDVAVTLRPFALTIQRGIPEKLDGGAILHEGAVGIVGDRLYDQKYNKLADGKKVDVSGVGGWIGITNKYWLAAVIPPQDLEFEAQYLNVGTKKDPVFRTNYFLPPVSLAGGQSYELVSHVFGGAKEVDILQNYQASPEEGGLGIAAFDKAVDWGFLNILTRPIFFVLNYFGELTGNFGIAILILTLIIKAILFPLANKGYESMTRMKKLQPQVEKLKERYGDDKMKLQQEMMAIYKKEKINPMAGCLPILIQMPIFFALYKTLFVTLELRHEPFFGWIRDLSAPDPSNVFNLFGLIPFDPTTLPLLGVFLGVGILPIIMGVGMWFQMSLSPPPPDPVQRQIFSLLPVVFTFLFAGFAAGLVIYWVWNTFLSIAQQMFIMKNNGVEIEWRERFSWFFPKDKKALEGASDANAKITDDKKKS